MLQAQTAQFLHQSGEFEGDQKLRLYYQSWSPAGSPQAIAVLVHGLGSHSGLFGPIVERLTAENYRVYAFDLRGHGRSPGQRAYINGWSEYRNDLRLFLEMVSLREGDRPCFLFGHSLGGAIALEYALRFPQTIQGLILSAPALSVQGISPFKIKVGKLLSLVWSWFSLETGIRDRQPSTRDAAVNAAYAQDSLRHTRGTARLSTEFQQVNARTWRESAQLRVPLLLLQGEVDAVAPVAIARQFFEQLPIQNKTLRVYSGGYHEIFNDINRDEVMDDLSGWMAKALDSAIRTGAC